MQQLLVNKQSVVQKSRHILTTDTSTTSKIVLSKLLLIFENP